MTLRGDRTAVPWTGRIVRVVRAHRMAAAVSAAALVAVLVGGVGAVALSTPASEQIPIAEESVSNPGVGAAGALQDPVALDSTRRIGVSATHVSIPAIGVSSALESLALDPAGELLPPVDFDLAGWYTGGVVPGDIGPAIIAGHVDSAVGPAVFARLGEVRDGMEIVVTLSDGESLTFVAGDSLQSAKATFPTSDVYGNVPTPQLRLITCDGTFDRSTGHYTDNLIVFATLAT